MADTMVDEQQKKEDEAAAAIAAEESTPSTSPPQATPSPGPADQGIFNGLTNPYQATIPTVPGQAIPMAPGVGLPAVVPSQGYVPPPEVSGGTEGSDQTSTNPPTPILSTPIGGTSSPMGLETTHTDTKKGLGDDAKAANTDFMRSAQETVALKMEADKSAAQVDALHNIAKSKLLEQQIQQSDAYQASKQAEIDRQRRDIEKVTSQYQDSEVDPTRHFGLTGTGSKLLAIVGMSLGAAGGALAHTDFKVGDLVQKAIDNDIDAQKANLAKTGNVLKQKQGALADYLQATGDMEKAQQLENARQLQLVENRYAAIAAGSSDPAIKASSSALATEFKNKNFQILSQVDQKNVADETKKAPLKNALEKNSDAFLDGIKMNAAGVAALDRLKDIKKVVGTGAIAGRWRAIKGRLGIQAENEAQFDQALEGIKSNLFRSISGATIGAEEMKRLTKLGPDGIMNDATFSAVADSLRKNLYADLQVKKKMARDNGTRDFDPDEYINTYKSEFNTRHPMTDSAQPDTKLQK